MSVATSNHYHTAVKGLFNWLTRQGRTASNPLNSLSRTKANGEVSRQRRALSADAFTKLIGAAHTAGVEYKLSGPDRAMLYLVAAYTGLRARELSSLSESSFDFEGEIPTVTVEAGYSKRLRRDTLPLHPDLANRLRQWFAQRAESGRDVVCIREPERARKRPLWPGEWAKQRHAAKFLRKDLEAAGIPYRDDEGHVFDFHALRHQFISTLAQHGVHPKSAQELARHSKITLTMDYYTHLRLADSQAAVGSLPPIVFDDRPAEAATGTDD